MSNLTDQIVDFFAGLKSTNKTEGNNTNEKPTGLPPLTVVRTPDIQRSSATKSIAPKIEKDLVKVGNIPTMSNVEYNKVYAKENALDMAKQTPDDYINGFVNQYKDAGQHLNYDLAKTIVDTAKTLGESPAVLFRMAKHESKFDPRAVNKHTKAAGLFQFLPSTWKDVQDRLGGAKLGIKDPMNPEHNTKAAIVYLQDIKKTLSKVKDGSKITDGDLYLGHFSGAGRASQVIKTIEQGKGSLPANKVYLPREIKANLPIFYENVGKNGKFAPGRMKTVKEVYDTIAVKMQQNVNSLLASNTTTKKGNKENV